MPKYVVTDPATGRKVTLTGDSPPTEQELEEVFSSLPAKADFSGVTGGTQTYSEKPKRSGIDVASWVTGKPSESGLYDMIGNAILPTKDQRDQIRKSDSVTNTIMELGDPMQHRLMDLPHGLTQALQHGLEYGSEKLLGRDSGITASLRNDNMRADAELIKREQDYQARNPDTVATYAGAGAGAALPWLVGVPEKALTYTMQKMAPKGSGLLRRTAAGTAAGGLMATVAPVTQDGQYADQKANQIYAGMATGGAIPLTGAAASGLWNGGKSLFNMLARPEKLAEENIARLYGANMETVDKLRNAPQYFDGETVTAAQALQTPEAVMAEKALRNRPDMKAAFTNADNANNAGRIGLLQKNAGTDEQLTGLLAKRRQDSAPYLAELNNPNNKVSPSSVVAKLQELAKRGNATVSGAAKSHLAKIQENTDAQGNVPALVLDDIRQDIGGMLARHAPQNSVVNSQESALYEPVSTKIIKALDERVPGYRDYLRTYRSNSTPINTIEASRRILGPLDNRRLNSSGDQSLTLNDVAQGFKRDDKARYGMSPEARADLGAIQDSLQRRSISESLPSAGSDTAYNLQADGWLAKNLLGPTMQGPTGKTRGTAMFAGGLLGHQMGLPYGLGETMGVAAGLQVNKIAEILNARITSKVGAGAVNSKEAARMIESFLKANPQNRKQLLEKYPQWVQLLGSGSQKAITQE